MNAADTRPFVKAQEVAAGLHRLPDQVDARILQFAEVGVVMLKIAAKPLKFMLLKLR